MPTKLLDLQLINAATKSIHFKSVQKQTVDNFKFPPYQINKELHRVSVENYHVRLAGQVAKKLVNYKR